MRLAMYGCLAVGLVVFTLPAFADQTSDEVRRHFEAGSNAFNLGEFTTAVEEYKAAYKLHNDPVFLYDIAQAYRLANDFNQALFFYRSYLHNRVDPPNRAEIEERIRVLEEQRAQRKKLEQPPNTAAPPAAAPPAVNAAQPTPSPATTASAPATTPAITTASAPRRRRRPARRSCASPVW